jgi:hypothetical protein
MVFILATGLTPDLTPTSHRLFWCEQRKNHARTASTMADPQGAILVDPMDEDDPIDDNVHVNILDEVFTRAWAEVNRQQHHSFLEIDGQREHYI